VKKYGYFTNGGQQYVITNPATPRHWYNYMWKDRYITFTSQVGYGEGFAQDDMGRRVINVDTLLKTDKDATVEVCE
jgi:cellobiose phosphorylase